MAWTVLLIAPWLIAAGIYAYKAYFSGSGARDSRTAGATSSPSGQPGPWGQLEVTPIIISPPMEYVPTDWGPQEPLRWRFPVTDRPQLEQFLTSAGLGRDAVSQLLASAEPDPQTRGLIVSPSAELVRNLTPEQRAAIYGLLAKTTLNVRQYSAYRQYAQTPEEWLKGGPISPGTLELVKPWMYRSGDFLFFSDIDFVRAQIGEGPELQRLAKTLLRERTMLVRLRIPDESQIDQVAEYWGRGGRRTDIRPLLESIAVGGQDEWIDVSHLLPTMARQYLYRYPKATLKDMTTPWQSNCFWTALNFFNVAPDDRLLNPSYVFEKLKTDYYVVHDNLQLGDVMTIADDNGQYFHAAVYLADNLVFGKNGVSQLSPWIIVPIDRLKGYYEQFAGGGWHITYHRRKDL